jgi:nucleoside-diphosphate-sugar epimerase
MKILIFGGAGYLGIPFSNLLVNEGYDVTVYDIFKYSKEEHLNPNVKIIKDDILNVSNHKDIFNNIDYIFYFSSPRLNEITSDEQVECELDLLKNVCSFVGNKTKFIFNSSCSVYGKSNSFMNEKSEVNLTTRYSKLKVLSENYLLSNKSFKSIILRLSTLFGDSIINRDDLLINKIVYNHINGEEINIFDEKTERPYLHVVDCANILLNIINTKIEHSIINIGYNNQNYTKKEIIEIIEKTINDNLNVQYFDTKDSRSYFVNFNLMKNYINYQPTPIQKGIYGLYINKKIVFSLEDWDTILNFHRPNGSSRTWYLEETGQVDFPKMWGRWNILNVEDGNKMFGIDTITEQVIPSFYSDYVEFLTKEELEGKNHIYLINIYDPNFFKRNYDIGFKCISEQYLNDIREGRSCIVMVLTMEGYSGSDNNYDLEIIDKWINEVNIPHDSVYFISGNLIIDKVIKEKGLKFTAIPVSTFDTWVNYDETHRRSPVKFEPRDEKYFYLSYNRNPRLHRIELMSQFLVYDLLDKGKVSMNTFHLEDIYNDNDDDRYTRLNKITPLKLDKELNINWANDLTFIDYHDTFISVVTETLTDNNTLFLSEKIFKPLSLGHPFIVLGNKNTLKKLKELGYKTFSKWIDESYDEKDTMEERSLLITKEIKKLTTKSIDELKQIREDMYDICLHNQNNFRKTIIEKYSFNESEMNSFKEILSIINKIYAGLNKKKYES